MTDTPDVPEFVDINHPYVTDHDEKDFIWGFDAEKALDWAAAVMSSVIDHTMHGGPQHAIDQMAVQSGMLLSDAKEGLQFPVLMMHHKSEDGSEGYTPVAILLVGNDRIFDVAHTMGSLVDEDGVHPALPSRGADAFYSPPVPDNADKPLVEDDPSQGTPPTTVFDILAKQREQEDEGA